MSTYMNIECNPKLWSYMYMGDATLRCSKKYPYYLVIYGWFEDEDCSGELSCYMVKSTLDKCLSGEYTVDYHKTRYVEQRLVLRDTKTNMVVGNYATMYISNEEYKEDIEYGLAKREL